MFNKDFEKNFKDTIPNRRLNQLYNIGKTIIDDAYDYGVLDENYNFSNDRTIAIVAGRVKKKDGVYADLTRQDQLTAIINSYLTKENLQDFKNGFTSLFFDLIQPNLSYDKTFTDKALQESLDKIIFTRGSIERGTLIVAKGEVVQGDKFQILKSLESEYKSQVWNQTSFYWVLFAYTLLVSLALLMLLLFLRKYRPSVFDHNTKVTFIFFNIFLMVFLTTLVINYNSKYIYVVPICIMPLIFKAFFDARLGLFAHVITVLLLGFIVPNSYEYMFLQIIAGIVLNGLATLFVQPLIYAYEKLFGLVSDVSLLELSDTNSKLLKELSNVAPGTFHHSLNVANLAEASANEIGANAMLVRVGALYHDIGKMKNPTYFIENQSTGINPHDELSAKESAGIIINHVIDGIEIARKNNLPDRVIDFIRTHHGTSLVYYFYVQHKKDFDETDTADFKYPGPKPFSKETAILMMSDSIEAASKSIKEPTTIKIDTFVENIIDKQIEEGQFLNANITFKEIQSIKKVLKLKLANIYHLRIEYPE